MRKFGVLVQIKEDMDSTPSFLISADKKYISLTYILMKGDASSASYFLAG